MNYRSFLTKIQHMAAYELGKLDNIDEDNSNIKIISDDNNNYNLGDWLDNWFKLYKTMQNAPSTLAKQLALIKIIKASFLGNISLSALTAINMQSFLVTVTAPRQREHLYTLLRMH